MHLTDKFLKCFILDNLSARQIPYEKVLGELEKFKSGPGGGLNWSLVLVRRKEYGPPEVTEGFIKYETYKTCYYLFKSNVARISHSTIGSSLKARQTGLGAVTSTFASELKFEIGIGTLSETSIHRLDWTGLEFIRNLSEKDYGNDWWLCYN